MPQGNIDKSRKQFTQAQLKPIFLLHPKQCNSLGYNLLKSNEDALINWM
jgi:hypothetical protein